MQRLEQYPEEIRKIKFDLKNKQDLVRSLDQEVKNCIAEFKAVICEDKSLKNADARAWKLVEAKVNSEYFQEKNGELEEAQSDLRYAEIALEFLIDEFAVAKIQARHQTALIMKEANSTESV